MAGILKFGILRADASEKPVDFGYRDFALSPLLAGGFESGDTSAWSAEEAAPSRTL